MDGGELLPRDPGGALQEAAIVDGDSRTTAFRRRIVLPLTAPGLVTTAIFAVIVTFNEFLVALALTSTPDAETVPRGVSRHWSDGSTRTGAR